MKIRKGFVSNSSSTNFTCEICGEDISGMDLGLEDAEMYQCENGHRICQSHIKNYENWNLNVSFIIMKQYVLNELEKNNLKNKISEAEKLKKKITEAEDETELEEICNNSEDITCYDDVCYEMREDLPAEFCSICNFKKPDVPLIYQYFLKESNLTEKQFLGQIKEKFDSFKAFYEYTKR